jgi:hypothetical protein
VAGEHRCESTFGQLDVFELRAVKPHGGSVTDPQRGRHSDHVRARLDRLDAQPSCEQRRGQVPGPTADLDHPVAGAKLAPTTRSLDQLIWIRRPRAVVLLGNRVENLTVAPSQLSVVHTPTIRPEGRPKPPSSWASRDDPNRIPSRQREP